MEKYNRNLMIGFIALSVVIIIHLLIVVNFNQSHVISTITMSFGFYPALFFTLIAVRASQKKEYFSKLQEEEK
jgi:hypothetical protein